MEYMFSSRFIAQSTSLGTFQVIDMECPPNGGVFRAPVIANVATESFARKIVQVANAADSMMSCTGSREITQVDGDVTVTVWRDHARYGA